MYITAQGPRLRNDLYCVEWDVKLYYTIAYHTPTEGVPLKLGNIAWAQEARRMGLPWQRKMSADFQSRFDTVDKCDRRTDGQTPADS